MLSVFKINTKIYFLVFAICLVFSSCDDSGENGESTQIVKFSNIQEFTANVAIKPQRLNVVGGFVSSVQKDYKDFDNISGLLIKYSYNDIKFEKYGDTYIILNNTPTAINELTVNYNNNSEVALLKFSKQIPAFSDAKFSILEKGFNDIKYDNQMSLFLPRISQNETSGNEGPPDKYQEGQYRIIVANIHNAVNERLFVKKIHTFFDGNCQNFDLCVEYSKSNPKLSYATRNTLQFGSNGHRLLLYVLMTHGQEGLGVGTRPKLDFFGDATNGTASLWKGNVDPPRIPSSDNSWVYYGLFHEICHGYSYNHAGGASAYAKGNGASGMNSVYQRGFDRVFQEWQKTNPDEDRIPPLKTPKIFVKAVSIGDKQVILKYYYIPTNFAYDKLDIKLIMNTAISGNMSVSGNEVKINLKNKFVIPLYVRSSSKDYTYESTLRIKPAIFNELNHYYINGDKYTVYDEDVVLHKNDPFISGDKLACGVDSLATRAQYEILWHYLSDNNKLDELRKKIFLASDGPNSITSWQLTFNKDFMKHYNDWVDATHSFGSDKGIVCISHE